MEGEAYDSKPRAINRCRRLENIRIVPWSTKSRVFECVIAIPSDEPTKGSHSWKQYLQSLFSSLFGLLKEKTLERKLNCSPSRQRMLSRISLLPKSIFEIPCITPSVPLNRACPHVNRVFCRRCWWNRIRIFSLNPCSLGILPSTFPSTCLTGSHL